MSNIEYTLIPIDRVTGIQAFEPKDVKPQIIIDLDEFHRVMRRVNPPEGLSALVLNDERDKELMMGTLARAISEMFGGDVYYRKQGEESWHIQPSLWRPAIRNHE